MIRKIIQTNGIEKKIATENISGITELMNSKPSSVGRRFWRWKTIFARILVLSPTRRFQRDKNMIKSKFKIGQKVRVLKLVNAAHIGNTYTVSDIQNNNGDIFYHMEETETLFFESELERGNIKVMGG